MNRKIVGLLFISTTLCFSGCMDARSENVEETEEALVKVLEVPDTKRTEIKFAATVEADKWARMAFRVPGQIKKIHVRMGQIVKKGELLAELDDADYQTALDAKKAEYKVAKLHAERDAKLYKDNLVSEATTDQTQANLQVAQAQLEQAKTDLSYTRIVAPFDGRVSLTFARAHEIVAANQQVLNLQTSENLNVSFNLPNRFSHLLPYAKQARPMVTFNQLPDVSVMATLKEVQSQADTETDSFPVTLTFVRPQDINILPGMPASVHVGIPMPESEVLQLVDSALYERSGNKAKVWKIEPSTMQISLADIVITQDNVVVSGLNPGDWVVGAGADKLTTGQKVRAWVREGGL